MSFSSKIPDKLVICLFKTNLMSWWTRKCWSSWFSLFLWRNNIDRFLTRKNTHNVYSGIQRTISFNNTSSYGVLRIQQLKCLFLAKFPIPISSLLLYSYVSTLIYESIITHTWPKEFHRAINNNRLKITKAT